MWPTQGIHRGQILVIQLHNQASSPTARRGSCSSSAARTRPESSVCLKGSPHGCKVAIQMTSTRQPAWTISPTRSHCAALIWNTERLHCQFDTRALEETITRITRRHSITTSQRQRCHGIHWSGCPVASYGTGTTPASHFPPKHGRFTALPRGVRLQVECPRRVEQDAQPQRQPCRVQPASLHGNTGRAGRSCSFLEDNSSGHRGTLEW